MSRLFLLILLLVGLAIGAAAFAPLATVLKFSGANERGLSWASANGSVLSGSLEGVSVRGKPLGSAKLKLAPMAILGGRLQYAVDWTGEAGRGTGQVAAGSGGSVSVREFDLDLDLLKLETAARWIQQSGGRVQIEGDIIRFDRAGCAEANGTARSDVLERNREILGTGWSPMQGDIRCDGKDLVIPLESENATGTRFAALLRVAAGQPGRFEARVSGMIPRQLEFALPIAGFTRDGNEFVYSFSAANRSKPI